MKLVTLTGPDGSPIVGFTGTPPRRGEPFTITVPEQPEPHVCQTGIVRHTPHYNSGVYTFTTVNGHRFTLEIEND